MDYIIWGMQYTICSLMKKHEPFMFRRRYKHHVPTATSMCESCLRSWKVNVCLLPRTTHKVSWRNDAKDMQQSQQAATNANTTAQGRTVHPARDTQATETACTTTRTQARTGNHDAQTRRKRKRVKADTTPLYINACVCLCSFACIIGHCILVML